MPNQKSKRMQYIEHPQFSNRGLFIVDEKAFLYIRFKSQIKNSNDNSNNLFEFAVCSTNKKSVDYSNPCSNNCEVKER